ncbi:protein MAIN-LIKE 2-like [Amaranthus tricolor]|uniref:protein MAIN-LIKE 2-like n=1 Tax=Amaranthus tricolor TaxID=29722 RepID=UPI0025842729|nr:protein MAIN-LIKE 2-like [Amaranthus tricolor]
MRPHPILAVNVNQQKVAWGAVTLACLYRQLGMASRAGCKTIAGCLTLLQTWIYEYFPAFRPHPRREDVPNMTRAEMWSTKKPCREVDRLRDCRRVLDSMTETQVEWTPYISAPSALLNEHPRTFIIRGITCFDIVEVYLSEQTLRQIGFVQAIPPAPMRPTKALRPAHGTYSVTFASSAVYLETWTPDKGPTAEPGPSQSRAEYFLNEWPSRFAPVARLPPSLADMNPRQRHAITHTYNIGFTSRYVHNNFIKGMKYARSFPSYASTVRGLKTSRKLKVTPVNAMVNKLKKYTMPLNPYPNSP